MIPIAKPFLGEEETRAAEKVILSGWVTQGPKIKEFEEAFANYVGAKHACAVSNCTAALHLSLLAAGVKPGNVVITVSHSFIAAASSIRYVQAEPVFVDIDSATYNISVELLRETLEKEFTRRGNNLYYKSVKRLKHKNSPLFSMSEKTHPGEYGRLGAILIVHQLGLPCDLASILSLTQKLKVPVIEDAACAAGSEVSLDRGKTWEKIGRPHADISCFSFHPRKVLTTGDGGMLTTNTASYDATFRLLRQHGMSISDLKRSQSKKIMIEEYNTLGFNYRLTDIQAAVGIEQLKKLPAMIARRRDIAAYYQRALKNISWLKVPMEPVYAKSNWQSFPVCLTGKFEKMRDRVMQSLLDQGIATRPGVMNTHTEKPFQDMHWKLPHSEKTRQKTLLLPIFQTMTNEDLDKVIEALRNIS